MEKWIEGEEKWFDNRVVAVVIGALRLVNVYKPIWGTNYEEVENCMKALEDQIATG